jgi:hypothetical protein
VAENDSDTTLGLEEHSDQILLCRHRTSREKMSASPIRQKKYDDDSPTTKWIQTPDAVTRRYKFFYCRRKNRTRKK